MDEFNVENQTVKKCQENEGNIRYKAQLIALNIDEAGNFAEAATKRGRPRPGKMKRLSWFSESLFLLELYDSMKWPSVESVVQGSGYLSVTTGNKRSRFCLPKLETARVTGKFASRSGKNRNWYGMVLLGPLDP